MTTNNQCNHAEAIAREMCNIYTATAHKDNNNPITNWGELSNEERFGWLAVAEQALPIIGKHALGDVQAYLGLKASGTSGWKKALYWAGGIILGGILAGGAATLSGCGHSVDVTPEKTIVCKDGSCLVIEQGHLSYSQAQPVTDVPPVVQTLKK